MHSISKFNKLLPITSDYITTRRKIDLNFLQGEYYFETV